MDSGMNAHRQRDHTTLSTECQEPFRGAFKSIVGLQGLLFVWAFLRTQRSSTVLVSHQVDPRFGAVPESGSDIVSKGSSRRVKTWKL